MLVIPPLLILATRNLVPPETRAAVEELFFPDVKKSLAVHLLEALALGGVAAGVWVWRVRWVRARAAGYAYPPGPDIPRLVVHAAVIVSIIALTALGGLAFVAQYAAAAAARGAAVLPGTGELAGGGRWVLEFADGVTGLVLLIITLGGALLAGGIRDWLHILMDIINHFYRRRERVPLPLGPLPTPDVHDFEIQQRIEHRFRRALAALLDDPDVSHLTVIGHSQGTVVAIDVLSFAGLSANEHVRLTRRLDQLREFTLVTMGSPITHLYQHYFPVRYPSFTDPGWAHFRAVVRRWVNVFRVDDFIGMDVETVTPPWAPWPGDPVNVAVGPGGHTGYWRDREVIDALLARPAAAAVGRPTIPG
ncbi:MAG TPA: hypothetical protein VH092_33970 [Urbifossiella sp.]|nr:hypothetical protein [Urbifossiella sp.]